jgi:hypothetical protein
MSTYLHAKPIVTDELFFSLDAYNIKSYISGSTSINSLVNNNRSGSLVNGVGFNGKALVFDGVNDRIDMDNNFYFGMDNFTVDFWLKKPNRNYTYLMDIVTNKAAVTIGPGTGGPGAGSGFQIYSGGWIFVLGTELGTDWYPVDEWFNVTCVRDTTESRLYLNGGHVFTDTSPDAVNFGSTTPGDAFQIGATGTFAPLDGEMSAIKIYTKALTSSEIIQNYEALKHRHNE